MTSNLNYSIERVGFQYKLFRFGYGLYRQIARRNFSIHLNDKFFSNITKFIKIKTTMIESFSNYPDLFMTLEILDRLSCSLLLSREG